MAAEETNAPDKPEDDDQPKDEQTSEHQPDDLNDQIEKALKGDVEATEREITKMANEWRRSVQLRLGISSTLYTGGVSVPESEVRNEINPDWSLTKAKTANLFSQVPTVRMTHRNKKVMLAIAPFEKSLNYEIGGTRARVKVAMREVLSDVVNAAGVGGVVVDWAARFENKKVPAQSLPSNIPPEIVNKGIEAGIIPFKEVPFPVDSRFTITHKSPTDLLYASNFTGSDFDDADWVGERGKMPWSVALHDLDLDATKKDALTKEASTDNRKESDLRNKTDKSNALPAPSVTYKQLFYWRYRYDPDCTSFSEIWRIVFVDGEEKAVKHERWLGQRQDEQTKKVIGACRYPVRFLTLTYITDNPIPPSDSAANRPQVDDLRRSRSQMFQNRDRSFPFRWFNTNLVDPAIWDNLMKGTLQGAVPINGTGDRAFGEVSRASYPAEDFSFDAATKQDLHDGWGLGQNQTGSYASGRKTKGESEIVQQNFATVIGQDRDAVATFFLGICDVVAGLMVLYSDWPILDEQEKAQMFQGWGGKTVLHDVVYKIRPDSTVVLDVPQRLQRIERFVNFTARSGMVNLLPVLFEYAELSGIDDVNDVIHPLMPKPPEEPAVSIRFSGKEDLSNIGTMAMLVRTKKAPRMEDIVEAEDLLAAIQNPEVARAKIQQAAQAQGGPAGPHPPGPAGPPRVPQGGVNANKDWTLNDKVMKRGRDAQ